MVYTDFGNSFLDGLEKLAEVITEATEELDDVIESFDEEFAELNAGKTQEEIDVDDVYAEMMAFPLVNALESIADIVNDAIEEIIELIGE